MKGALVREHQAVHVRCKARGQHHSEELTEDVDEADWAEVFELLGV